MHLRRRRKFVLLIIILGILSLLYNSLFSTDSLEVNFNNKNLATTKKEQIVLNQRVENNSIWIVNKNIVQYSAYVVFKENGLTIESIVYLTYNSVHNYEANSFKCLIKNQGGDKFLILPVKDNTKLYASVNKVTCEYDNEKQLKFKVNSKILIAIIYEIDFNTESGLPYQAIQYQRARLFNADKPKKQAVAHCVHMFYGIDSIDSREMLKFKNWVDMQKNIGIDQIRIYVLHIDEPILRHLNKIYGSYLTFVNHQMINVSLCEWSRRQVEIQPHLSLLKTLYDLCNQISTGVFGQPDIPTHDRICMNDCYLNFKYNYELFTNYDIDEIIFPRLDNIYDLSKFKSFNCNSSLNYFKPKYSIYDYAISLLNKFGRNKIACLMFKHVAFLPVDSQLHEFMRKIEDKLKNEIYSNVRYVEISNQSSHIYALSEINSKHAHNIVKYNKLIECLRIIYANIPKKISEEFQRYVALRFFIRLGKSIIDTNLTDTISHHTCENFLPSSHKFELELEYGYASHFRTDIVGFLDELQIDPITFVFTDFEYFLYSLNVLL